MNNLDNKTASIASLVAYSPGPWKVETDGGHISVVLANSADRPDPLQWLATINTYDGSKDQQLANAQLMACAPGLLDSLAWALATLDRHYPSVWHQFESDYQRARQVLTFALNFRLGTSGGSI
jgi:hypothetical protein